MLQPAISLFVVLTILAYNASEVYGAGPILSTSLGPINEPLTFPIESCGLYCIRKRRRNDVASIGLGDALDITYNVDVRVGSVQAPLVLDTGSADIWLLSDRCETCSSSQVTSEGLEFYPMANLNRVMDVELLYGDSRTGTQASGVLGSDSAGVAGFSAKGQYFAAINKTNTSVLDTGSNGIFGLGFPVNSILWNELYTSSILGSFPGQRRKRNLDPMLANNRQLPSRPPTAENYVEDGNVESMAEMSGARLSILSSFATYGPLLPRLILNDGSPSSTTSSRLPSPQFSVTLERTSPTISGNVGAFTLGGLPRGTSNDSLAWAPVRLYTPQQNGVVVPEARHETYPYAWEVPLEAVHFDGVKLEMSRLGDINKPGVGTSALIDTGNSLIRGPADVIVNILTHLFKKDGNREGTNTSAIFSSPPSASSRTRPKLVSAASTAREFIKTFDPYDYVYPCAQVHNLTFTLGGRTFPIDPRDFGRQAFAGDARWCVPNLAPTDAPVIGDYLYSWSLGQPFLKGVLSSFYYGNITHPSVDPPRVGFLSTVPADTSARFSADISAVQSAGGFLETTIQAPTGTFTGLSVTTDAQGVVQASEGTVLAFASQSSSDAGDNNNSGDNINDAQAFAPSRPKDSASGGDPSTHARGLHSRRRAYVLAVALSAAGAILFRVL